MNFYTGYEHFSNNKTLINTFLIISEPRTQKLIIKEPSDLELDSSRGLEFERRLQPLIRI